MKKPKIAIKLFLKPKYHSRHPEPAPCPAYEGSENDIFSGLVSYYLLFRSDFVKPYHFVILTRQKKPPREESQNDMVL